MQSLSKKFVAGILIRVPKAFVKLCYSHTRSTSQGTFISLPPADGISQIIHCDFRTVITDYLKETEPEAVTQRRYPARFKRRRFYAAGVNDIWAQDQHDKWGKKFGLWFHLCLDPFPGKLLWLKVWWTNSNPRLITKYYLDACREHDGTSPTLTCPCFL